MGAEKKTETNNVKQMYPNTREAFRQSSYKRLNGIDERVEKLYTLLDKVEAVLSEKIPQELENKEMTTYQWVCIHNKLANSLTQLEKIRLETYDILSGSVDELNEAEEAAKETPERKQVRQLSEKMLALLHGAKPPAEQVTKEA